MAVIIAEVDDRAGGLAGCAGNACPGMVLVSGLQDRRRSQFTMWVLMTRRTAAVDNGIAATVRGPSPALIASSRRSR
jgi:hypothetical protein